MFLTVITKQKFSNTILNLMEQCLSFKNDGKRMSNDILRNVMYTTSKKISKFIYFFLFYFIQLLLSIYNILNVDVIFKLKISYV